MDIETDRYNSSFETDGQLNIQPDIGQKQVWIEIKIQHTQQKTLGERETYLKANKYIQTDQQLYRKAERKKEKRQKRENQKIDSFQQKF